jgi:hypothetical protein
MNRASLISFVACVLLTMAAPTAAAQTQIIPAKVLWACYVPLTGTVYRISPDGSDAGLRTACSSTSHVQFSWNEQGPPGVSGYEVISSTVQKTYFSFFLNVALREHCLSYFATGMVVSCSQLQYDYHAIRQALPGVSDVTCPAGKKVVGASAADGVRLKISSDGSSVHFVTNTTPRVTEEFVGPPTSSTPVPSPDPEMFDIQVICATAS